MDENNATKEIIKEVVVYKYFQSKKEAQKKYREKNRDILLEKQKKYYELNKEKIREKQRKYMAKKREEQKN
jgi:hypothetical protein